MDGMENNKTAAVEIDEMAGAVESLDDIKDDTGDADLEEFDKAEGTDSDLDKDQATKEDSESKAEEAAKADLVWEQERQRADQAEANYRKAEQEKAALQAKTDATSTRIKELETQLSDLIKAEDINLDEADESITDPKVIKAIKSLQTQLKADQALINELKQAKVDIENQIKTDREEAGREQTRQHIVTSIEGKLQKRFKVENPVRFRNEAIEMANKICRDRGYSPRDTYEAAEMLEDCYLELVETAKPKTKNQPKPSVATDTGKGSGSAPVSSERKKSTSLREAVKDLRKGFGL